MYYIWRISIDRQFNKITELTICLLSRHSFGLVIFVTEPRSNNIDIVMSNDGQCVGSKWMNSLVVTVFCSPTYFNHKIETGRICTEFGSKKKLIDIGRRSEQRNANKGMRKRSSFSFATFLHEKNKLLQRQWEGQRQHGLYLVCATFEKYSRVNC